MNPAAMAAVLLGALQHLSWNSLVKSSTDKELDTALTGAYQRGGLSVTYFVDAWRGNLLVALRETLAWQG
ncbi:MAG: hypothetical protein IPN53_09190 [Comamonadaceae bacterium]|nr:hypothetical protein [Comamonadaceae bacterium]